MEESKINIVYIITRLVCGGAQNILISLATALDKEKYQITIITGDLPESGKELEFILRKNNIRLITIRQMVRNVSILKDIIATFRLYSLLRKGPIDIVHTHTSKAGALGRLAAFFTKTPIIIHTPHGNIFEPKGKIPGVSDRLVARLIFLFIERVSARFTDKITTLSDNEKTKYIELKIDKPDKFITIHDGIDYKQFLASKIGIKKEDFGFHSNDFIIGSVGRLDPEKGHVYLIEAASRLLKENPRFKFLIIGEGTCRSELEDHAAYLGIAESVRFLGLRSDISELLSIMDVFVLPSLYEGLGIAILEAMARSLPVVATRVGGVPEVIIDGKNGILIPAADSQAIAKSVIFLLENKEKARAMGDTARMYVEQHFDIKLMVEKLERLYNDLLNSKIYNKGGIGG